MDSGCSYVYQSTWQSPYRWRNVFGAYRQACTQSVYKCVCVFTVSCRSPNSPSECLAVFLQLRGPPPVSALNHTSGALLLPPLFPSPPLFLPRSAPCLVVLPARSFLRPRIPWIHAKKDGKWQSHSARWACDPSHHPTNTHACTHVHTHPACQFSDAMTADWVD